MNQNDAIINFVCRHTPGHTHRRRDAHVYGAASTSLFKIDFLSTGVSKDSHTLLIFTSKLKGWIALSAECCCPSMLFKNSARAYVSFYFVTGRVEVSDERAASSESRAGWEAAHGAWTRGMLQLRIQCLFISWPLWCWPQRGMQDTF